MTLAMRSSMAGITCVAFGFLKTKSTAGGKARVVKSLDERISHQPMAYLRPDAPHGPADQLGFERGHSKTHPKTNP